MANILQEREGHLHVCCPVLLNVPVLIIDKVTCSTFQSHFPLGWACFPTLPSLLHRTEHLWASPIAVFWVRRDGAAGVETGRTDTEWA